MKPKFLLPCLALALLISLTGCGVVYVKDPDPDAAAFVQATYDSGRRIVMPDGKSYLIAGMDAESLTPEQKEIAQRHVYSISSVPVLVIPLDNTDNPGLARVEFTYYHFSAALAESWGFPPFARVIHLPAQRQDLSANVISQGLFRVNETDPLDPQYMQTLKYAQLHAQQGHWGIWKDQKPQK